MIILVLNCGSSSVKYQVIDMTSDGHSLLAKGIVERIGLSDSVLTHKAAGKPVYEIVRNIPDHTAGINLLLTCITDEKYGVIGSLAELNAVGHRVAHGGEYFSDSAIVNNTVIKQIESCFELAPLHNPANLKGILSIENILPGIPQVATFDTSFHQTIPAKNFMYALPYRYYEEDRVRKYGFHGTSHKFVAEKACRMTGCCYDRAKIITCHIGNGASVTAILHGKSYDTSMGFTPADGLIMGTRTGEIDPGALIYIAEKEGLSYSKLSDLINKQSGVAGFTGISSDMRDIDKASANGDQRATLLLDMYDERLKKFIGAYAAAMGGVDLIVFTGGVAENGPERRRRACSGLEFMGLEFDEQANEGVRGEDKIISGPGSKVKVVVATTDEEYVIASDTFRLLKKRSE
ncbi:MAG: acetate kinase [Alistipes sp.]|nr:acetate kinase [Alistipes sp.]